MAGVSGWSWPIPFVVPPCTQSAILRNRHKVPRGSGSYGLLGVKPHRIVVAANLTAKCSSPILLRGYRPQRCQVAAKGPRNAAERVGMTTQLRPPKSSAAVSFGYLNRSWPARSGACAGFDGAVGTIGVDIERAGGTLDHFARDHDLFDAFQARQIEHGFEQDAFENRTQAARAGLALDRLAGDCAKRLIGERQLDVLHLEQPLILLHQRVLRIGQDLLERSFIEILQRGDHRQAADELRNQAVLQQILGLDVTEDLAGAAIFRRQHLSRETDRRRASARGDDFFQAGKRTAADEQNIRGVDLQELLLRMLAAALRRNRGNRAFHDLQQRLLHTLARHIPGDRRVVGFTADLVDFVDVDDSALRALDIIVGRLQQLEDDVFDVLADIAGFGQRGRIRHRERYVENPRQRLRQQRLARTGRTDQQDIRLRKLDIVVLGLVIEALVVIVNGDREHLLGVALTDHVIVENLADFLGGRNAVARLHQRRLVFLADDIHAQLNALVADEYRGTRDQFADFVLALAAERAIQRVLGVARADLTHSYLRPSARSPHPGTHRHRGVDRAKSVPKKTLLSSSHANRSQLESPTIITDPT